MGHSRGDLGSAAVGRDDALKVLREPERRLAVTGRAVPGQLRFRDAGCQLDEETRGVSRAVRGVSGCRPREEVPKRRQLFFAVFTNTEENVCSTRSLLHFGQIGRLEAWSLIRSLREKDSPQEAQRYSYVGTVALRRVSEASNRPTRNLSGRPVGGNHG